MKLDLLHLIFFLFLLYLLSVAPPSEAQQQQAYYVFDGKNLQVMGDGPVQASDQWQIWLYPKRVHIPHHTAGLPYSRWGLIGGTSAVSVMEQLETFQGFERAYLNFFFGPDEWGQYTFFNPLGPIAIRSEAVRNEPAEALYLSQLNRRVSRLIVNIQPSLENNKNESLTSPVKDYFDQVRDCLVQVSRLYSQLSHLNPQLHFIDDGVVRTRTAVAQAENNVREITAVLPSVRLPTSNAWMFHTEWAGSDGIIQVAIKEAGSGVSVEQTWTGGDGRMTGTDVLTMVPYKDIGSVKLVPPTRSGDKAWTVRVQSADASFPETWSCPERKTAMGILRAVNYRTTQHSVYLAFSNATEAQDAYAYFLYHQQLGR